MLEIIYYVAASVDGFIATPDGSVDWLSAFEGEDDYGYAEFYARVDAILIGRRTYEQVRSFGPWPYSDKPTWVFSRRELTRLPDGVTGTAGSPAAVASELEDTGFQNAWLVGGGELAGSFAREGLLTSCIITVMPVLLGDGIRLFGGSCARARLELESTTRYGDVVQVVYGLPH
jgi:dihydrofolate reductase